MKKKLNLKVGGIYETRLGYRVLIDGPSYVTKYPFQDTDGRSYRTDGRWLTKRDDHDLVKRVRTLTPKKRP